MLLRVTNKRPLMDRCRMERQVRYTWNGFERVRAGPHRPGPAPAAGTDGRNRV
jgi:hypothetical protein